MNIAPQLKKNNVCQIFPRPPNQCWSLFPALWSFRVWSTLCRGEGGKFYLGLGCSKIRQKRSSVSLLLKPIVASPNPKRMLGYLASLPTLFNIVCGFYLSVTLCIECVMQFYPFLAKYDVRRAFQSMLILCLCCQHQFSSNQFYRFWSVQYKRERETSAIISAEAWTLDWTSVAGAKLWL